MLRELAPFAVACLLTACGQGVDDPVGTAGSTAAGSAHSELDALPAGQRFVAENSNLDVQDHLVARRYFNEDSEVLSLFEPTPGTYLLMAAGSPINGRTGIAKFSSASELWAAISAPGQEPPAGFLEIMNNESAVRRDVSAAQTPAAAPPSALGAARVDSVTKSASTPSNYCNNGSFFNDWGTGNAENSSNSFWSPVSYPFFVTESYSSQGFENTDQLSYSFSNQVQAGFAVCAVQDEIDGINGPFTNNLTLQAGSYAWYNTWSDFTCGFNVWCCLDGTCERCSVPAVAGTWTAYSLCPIQTGTSNTPCLDGSLMAFVEYSYSGAGSVCE
jgi:hypothetical protein